MIMRQGAGGGLCFGMMLFVQTALQPTTHAYPKVTLVVQDSTIEYAVREIARQAHVRVAFNESNHDLSKRISVRLRDVKIDDAFAAVLKGTNLIAQWGPDSETVVVHERPKTAAVDDTAAVQTGVVTGQVTDSTTGQGVASATVVVQGTKLSVVTANDGSFSMSKVPIGDQLLTVKLFGYKPSSRQAVVQDGQRTRVSFVLTPTATVLSGVVTTATGIQSKMSVGSDITTINVDSVMRTAPISSVTDLLATRVPGLTVVHTSGNPGAPARLLLRGAASVTGNNNPIVVVDGVRVYSPQDLGNGTNYGSTGIGVNRDQAVPSPLDQIDPNLIETIEVLKGPSASALYGSDAANGVIVITTKKGRPGQTHWSVSADQGINYIPGSFPALPVIWGHVLQDQDVSQALVLAGGSGQLEAGCYGGLSLANIGSVKFRPCIFDSAGAYQALNDPRLSPLTTGSLSSASATLSGGAQALTYSFTGSISNRHGDTKMPLAMQQEYVTIVGSTPPSWMIHPDDYPTWSTSGQLGVALGSRATLTVQDNLMSSTQRNTGYSLSAVGNLISAFVDTASLFAIPDAGQFFEGNTNSTVTSTAAATLQWQVRPWLPLTVTAGLNRNQRTDIGREPSGLSSTLGFGTDTDGFYEIANAQATVATLNANTTVPLPVGQGRRINLSVGTNFVNQSMQQLNALDETLPVGVSDPTTFPVSTTSDVQQTTQSGATYGWFVEPKLTLGSRIYVTPGIRLDGGTASGRNAGTTIFPKTNFSYIMLDHSGETDGPAWANLLTLLRLRGAFGIAGVQPTPQQDLRLFSAPQISSLNGGTTPITETVLSSLGNTILRPERSRETEVGFDAQVWENRVSLTATYYNKLRINAIQSVPVAPSVIGTTATSYYMNIGNILNTGFELTGDAQIIVTGPALWSINGIVSTSRNTVLSNVEQASAVCSGIGQYATSGANCARAGYPLGAYFARRLVGYADANGDGVIEPDEIQISDSSVYVGSGNPRYTASMGTTLSLWHGHVAFSSQWDYQNGMTVSELGSLANAFLSDNLNPSTLNQALYLGSNLKATAAQFQTVNTLRWDALSVTCTLPAAIARFFRSQQTTIAIQGSNLGLLTNYRSKDPDINSQTTGLGVSDNGGLPQPRTWQLTMRVTQ